MSEFEFTLELAGIDELNQAIEDALFVAGCDDASLGIRAGRAYLHFSRDADSLKDAVSSAIRNVHAAGFEVLAVADCDKAEEFTKALDLERELRALSEDAWYIIRDSRHDLARRGAVG